MRALLLCLFVSIVSLGSLSAQIGLSANYNILNAPGWDNIVNSHNLDNALPLEFLNNGIGGSLDFRFALKNIRFEYGPEISFNRGKIDQTNKEYKLVSNHLGLWGNGYLYFLDLYGACDCPTFSKEGPTLQKGLHLIVGAGLNFHQYDVSFPNPSLNNITGNNLNGGFKIGAGFDMGISDAITITPFCTANFLFKPSLDDYDQLINQESFSTGDGNQSTMNQIALGIRIGLHN